MIPSVDHRGRRSAHRARQLTADTLSNGLVKLHRRTFASRQHHDREAAARRNAGPENVRVLFRNVITRDSSKLWIDLDHRPRGYAANVRWRAGAQSAVWASVLLPEPSSCQT